MNSAKRVALAVGILLAAISPRSPLASQEPELDPTKLAPNIYEVALENEHVRVLKVTARPGETPPVHSHPDRVLVSVNGCVDDVAKETMDAGEVTWEPAVTHGGQKITSTGECVYIEVELK